MNFRVLTVKHMVIMVTTGAIISIGNSIWMTNHMKKNFKKILKEELKK